MHEHHRRGRRPGFTAVLDDVQPVGDVLTAGAQATRTGLFTTVVTRTLRQG